MPRVARLSLCAALFLALDPAAFGNGSAVEAPAFVRGDAWRYSELEGFSRLPLRSHARTVTATEGGAVRIAEIAAGPNGSNANEMREEWLYSGAGALASGSLNERARGALQPALQLLPFPLVEGKTWSQTVVRTDPALGAPRVVTLHGKVLGWETVKVPAGEFRALKIERDFLLGDQGTFRSETQRTEYEWYVPQLKSAARIEVWEISYDHTIPRILRPLLRDRRFFDLVSFEPGHG